MLYKVIPHLLSGVMSLQLLGYLEIFISTALKPNCGITWPHQSMNTGKLPITCPHQGINSSNREVACSLVEDKALWELDIMSKDESTYKYKKSM